jgi:PGF-pre-PGF domain-containing protein
MTRTNYITVTYVAPTQTPTTTSAPASSSVAAAAKPVQYGEYGQGLATANAAPAGQTVSYVFGYPTPLYPVSTQTVSFVPIEAVPQSQCVVQQQSPSPENSLTGRPAAYYSIEINPISPDVIASGTIHFSVLGSWLSEKQIDPANVVLLRNHDLVWTELPTSFDHTDGDNYYYYSDTPGYSYFAVSDGHPTPAKITSQTTVSLAEKGEPTSPPITGTEITTPGQIKPAPESIIPSGSAIPVHDNTLYVAGIILICAGGAIYLIIQKIPHKTRVLIVDDEPQICEVLSLILTTRGFKTTKAFSGEECLSLLKNKKNHPDAILLDITMYPMDGWKTLEKLKKDPVLQSIPVLMLTGKQLIPEEVKRYGIYIEDYIHKPVLADELYGAIEYVLNRKQKIAGEIQMAIKAGNDKTLVCEYAKLAKQTDVEKKLLEHIRTAYTGVGKTKHEIQWSIEDLANEVQRREETMIQLRQRLSGSLVSYPAPHEDFK